MKTTVDTSALISLSVVNILNKGLEVIEIYIPGEVKTELIELTKYRDVEGFAAKKVLNFLSRKKICLVKLKNKNKIESIISNDIQHGEAACFLICLENKIPILIMDDIDASYALERLAKINKIKLKISIAIIIELYKKEKINKEELKSLINKLVKQRRWQGGILEVLAKEYLNNIIR